MSSLPYQVQDIAVGACATTALWVASHPLTRFFGVPSLALAEITSRSTESPGLQRSFPSTGLDIFQMLHFIHGLGLDAEVLDLSPHSAALGPIAIEAIPDAVKAYVNCGLPIIATIILHGTGKPARRSFHAVVISGYRADQDGNVKELYVHDDQIGPYSRVHPQGNFSSWRNEWLVNGYGRIELQHMIVPIYPKMRLPFSRIYRHYRDYRRSVTLSDPGMTVDLFLTQLNPYKEALLAADIRDKAQLLQTPCPRFLWVIRVNRKGKPHFDVVFDGTAVFLRRVAVVRYN